MGKNKEEKNWLEWLITIISGILVFFTLGFLIYQLIYEEQRPPDIQVSLGEISQKDGAFSVPIKVLNLGTETAENVIIEILDKEDPEQEKAKISFPYLPGKSSVKGWVIFNKEPRKHKLSTQVKGYGTP